MGRSEYFAHLVVGWRNSFLTALTALLLVLTSRRLGVQRLYAWIAGLSYGIATFAWPQARSTLSDVQGTFFLFLGFYVLLRMREEFKRLHEPRARHLFGLGACLAAAVLTRVALAPDIPTVAESADLAVPFVSMLWNVVTAPRGTPPQVMSRLRDATQRVMTDPALRSKLESQAMFVDLHIGPAAVAYVKAERARLAPVVDSLGDLKQG